MPRRHRSVSALAFDRVAPAIPLLVSVEVSSIDAPRRLRFFSAVRHRSPVAVLRMVAVVYTAAEIPGAMKPRAGADENAPTEPFRSVIAGGSAAIGNGVVVAIRTFRSQADGD